MKQKKVYRFPSQKNENLNITPELSDTIVQPINDELSFDDDETFDASIFEDTNSSPQEQEISTPIEVSNDELSFDEDDTLDASIFDEPSSLNENDVFSAI